MGRLKEQMKALTDTDCIMSFALKDLVTGTQVRNGDLPIGQ